MAQVILTYDIDDEHIKFKKELKKLKYSDQIQGSKESKVNLPNTTMYHSSKTAKEAREDAKAVAKKLQVNLERCIAIEISTWAAIIGDEHSE